MDVERWRTMMIDLRNVGLISASTRGNEGDDLPAPDFPSKPETQPDSICAREQLRSVLGVAMKTLPERYQKVVLLYYTNEMTMKEIGGILGINESRVSQIHKSALEKMQVALQATGITSSQAFLSDPILAIGSGFTCASRKTFQQADHRPCWIELLRLGGELGRRRKLVMVVMQALASSQPGDHRDVGREVIVIAISDHVAQAVDGRIQQYVSDHVKCPRRQTPAHPNINMKIPRPDERSRACQEFGRSGPACGPACISGWSLHSGFHSIVKIVSEQDVPQPQQVGAMRIAFTIRKMVMLAVDRHPLTRHDAGEQTQVQMHQIRDDGVQVQTAMTHCPVQINRGQEDGGLQDNDCYQEHPQEAH